MLNTSSIKISVDMVVLDSGATGHFILPGTKVSNMKISKKPLTINLPDSPQLKLTHTCEINDPRLFKESKQAHVLPGMSHTSLISMKILTEAGCKVVYNAHDWRVYFRDKIVWTGGKEPKTGLWVLPSVQTVKHHPKMETTMTYWSSNSVQNNTWQQMHMPWRAKRH